MNNLSKFAENLSALMEERGLNAPTLAKELKTDRSNITRYLRGERFPVFSGFIAIIDYFHVSADVILGLLDYSAQTDFLPILPFGQRLREVMNETGTTQYRIEKNEQISGASMYKWLFDQSLPSVENLVKLAKHMDVSVDYLLGRVR